MPVTKISKEEIIDIALERFLNDGIQSITMKQFTEPMGISTKTIYAMFTSKAALLKTCLITHYSRFFTELSKIASDANDEMGAVIKIIDKSVELEFKINPQFYRDLNKYYPELQNEAISSQSKLLTSWGNIIDKGKKNGLFLPEINKDVFWITFQQLYSGITRENFYEDLGLSGQELIKNTVLVFIRGICTKQGLQKLELHIKSQTLKML